MITLRTPTGDKGAATITVRTPTGDKAVERMVLRTPTGDKDIYVAASVPLVVSASPISAVGSVSTGGIATVTSNDVTVTATGGTAPYSYAWAYDSGSGTITATSPAAATTRFSGPVASESIDDAIFECTVTDARGRTGSVLVGVTLYNF